MERCAFSEQKLSYPKFSDDSEELYAYLMGHLAEKMLKVSRISL